MAASQDRTQEFFAAAQSLRSTVPQGVAPSKVAATPVAKHKEFIRIAKLIAKDVLSASEKLEKLSYLATKRGAFGDNPTEIQELTYIIEQDMQSINRAIKQLKAFSAEQHSGTRKDQLHQHASTVVVSLQSQLASTTQRFKSVLEVRTENLKATNARRQQFTDTSRVASSASMSILMGTPDAAPAAGPAQAQQLALVNRQDTYITDRADAMQAINSTIVELGGIFQQLAVMVAEQGEQVARIDANVADAELNVEAAHTELGKYLQSVTANRWLMLKIFGILIFFFIIFVVFAA